MNLNSNGDATPSYHQPRDGAKYFELSFWKQYQNFETMSQPKRKLMELVTNLENEKGLVHSSFNQLLRIELRCIFKPLKIMLFSE